MVVGGVVGLGVRGNHFVALLKRGSHHNGIEILAKAYEQLSASSECRDAPRRPLFHIEQRKGREADGLERDMPA